MASLTWRTWKISLTCSRHSKSRGHCHRASASVLVPYHTHTVPAFRRRAHQALLRVEGHAGSILVSTLVI